MGKVLSPGQTLVNTNHAKSRAGWGCQVSQPARVVATVEITGALYLASRSCCADAGCNQATPGRGGPCRFRGVRRALNRQACSSSNFDTRFDGGIVHAASISFEIDASNPCDDASMRQENRASHRNKRRTRFGVWAEHQTSNLALASASHRSSPSSSSVPAAARTGHAIARAARASLTPADCWPASAMGARIPRLDRLPIESSAHDLGVLS